jgi:hypothetical protein
MAAVSYSHVVREKLLAWAVVAVRIRVRDEFTAALAEMDDRLRTDPESWGDPLYDYRGLHLTVYRRYGPILLVNYAVHIDGTPVFVSDVQLRPGTPLDYAVG